MAISTRVLGKYIANPGTGTSFSVPLDFTPYEGEYITVEVTHTFDSSGGMATVNGYGTLLTTTDIKTQYAPFAAVYSKFAGASEPASITLAKGNSNAQYSIIVLGHMGVNASSPVCGTAKAVDSGGGATGNAPTLTPTAQPCRVFWGTASQNYRAAADSTYAWTGATKAADAIGDFNISTTAYEDRTALTATGTRAWSIGNYGGNTPAINFAFALREVDPTDPVIIETIEVDGTNTPATLTTPAFSPEANETILVFSIAGHTTVTVGAATNNAGLTVTNRDASSTASYTPERLDTIQVGSTPPASMTVSANFTGSTTGTSPTLIVVRIRGRLATTPALNTTKTGTTSGGSPAGTPSGSVTTTGVNSRVVWVSGDWVPVTSGTPTYRSSATQLKARRNSSINVFAATQAAAAAGAQTIGMTAPTGQKWTMLGIEVLGNPYVFVPPAAPSGPEPGRFLMMAG